MDIIRKSQGNVYSAPLCEGSLVHRELMGDHYILLVFNSEEAQHFRLGDYCDTDFGRFELTDLYEPEYNEDGGFKYSLRLDAYYMKWKNKTIKFTPSNKQSEMSFTLTRDLAGHMELFMSNLNYLGEKDSNYLFNGTTAFTFDIDYTHISKKMMAVSYDSLSLIAALNQYAELWECEWWVTDNVIHLGRCEGGVAVTNFKLNDNVAQMSRSQGSKQYITRLYVFGSERNIPANYRKSESEMVVNGVVQRRLMLPEGTPYLQVAGITEEQAVEGVLILDNVYPRTQCKVGAVSTYVSKGTDEEGNETTETFYRVSDTSGFINSIDNDMRLDGDSFHIRFTSGKMNGMEFDCNLVTNDQRINRCFEVIANEDYGIKLPREGFCPESGDEYIIFGWDSTKIADTTLIRDAENELLTEGQKYLDKSMVDPSEYTCTMISKKMQDAGMPVKYGRDQGTGHSQYVPLPYDMGDKVTLENPALFGSSRSSRIIGYEIKLDIPADSPQFIVGESLRYSKTGSIEAKVNELAYGGNLYTGAGGAGGGSFYIIGTGDTTPASNKNVYSAIRSDNQYARKDRNDVIKSLWTFKNGNGVRRGLQTEDYLLNTNEGNLFGKGFELVSQTNALGDTRTRLEVDELFVRIKAFFASLEIREMSYVGGNYVFSAAGSKIYYVEWLDANGNIVSKTGGSISSVYKFRCYLYSDDGSTATINKWAVDDQIMCRKFNIDEGVHQNVSNKYYWRRVPNEQDAIGCEIIKTRALAAIEKQYIADIEAINEWQVMTDEEKQAQQQALADLATARESAIAAVNAGSAPEGAADDEAFTEYQYVDISMDDCDAGSDYPEDEDTIVQLGNWTNAARQGVIYLQAEGEGSPAIIEYAGVGADGKHFVYPEPNLLLSPKKNIIYGEFHSIVDSESGTEGSGDSIDDQLKALLDKLNDIQNQADKKFELWFGTYVPTPNIIFATVKDTDGSNPASMGWYEVTGDRMYEVTDDTTPVSGKTYYIKTDNNTTPNFPASEWNTEALKSLHAQDLFYDTMREPASDGGRAWRWEAISVDGVVIYRWIETFDKDTIDALEKISDVASDGKLTGGAEKTRVYIDWMKAVQDYLKYEEQARDYGLNDSAYWGTGVNVYQAYITAYKKLARLLNGDDTTSESLYVPDSIMNGTTAPAWLADLSTTTEIPSAVIYRQIWNAYYDALALLLKAIQKRAKELADAAQEDATTALNKIGDMGSDGKLDPSEKLTVKREFVAHYHEMMDTDEAGYASGILDMAKDANGAWLITYDVWIAPYIAAFRNIGKYLNGGTAWTEPALAQFADDKLPSWIKEANMETTNDIVGDTWRGLWADFYAKRTAVLTALTDHAQGTADDAHDRIDDIVSDGIISAGSEKSLLYIEWLKAVAEYKKYIEQAEDYFGSNNTQDDALVSAYTNLAKMLNNGDNPSSAILNGTARPAWLTTENMNADTVLADTPTLTSANYHSVWNSYQVALTALLEAITAKAKELADAAQEDATTALNKIGDMGSDGKLDPSEKLTVKREFIAAWNEKDKSEGIIDKCYDANNNLLISSTTLNTYINAFVALGTYLNGSTNWNAGSSVCSDTYRATDGNLPSWIQSGNMSTTNNITGSTWRTKWSDFYAARTAVMTALSEAAKNAADEAFEEAVTKVNYFVGASVPTPPYKEGDLWLKTSTDNPTLAQAEAGEMFVCVVSRQSGTGLESDWANMKEITEKRDPRILLAALVSMVYSYNGGYLRNKGTNEYQYIYLGSRPSSGHAAGDISFYNGTVYVYTSSWSSISNDTLLSAFKAVYEVIGTYNLRIFRTRPTITKQMYDLTCRTITFTDTNFPAGSSYRTVEGGVNIEMWNGSDWEVLQKSAQSLIENLSGYVRAVAYSEAEGVVNSSGFITSSDWATLFSQATDADGNIIAQAHLGTYVTKDSNGKITSGITLDADQINFKGKTVINGKFVVDAYGNVTMDGFTATSATITGTVTADTGKIGGFTISNNGLTHIVSDSDINSSYNMGYIICRNDYHSRFAGIGANVLPASTGASAVARFENNDDTETWFGTNIAAIVSAKNAFTDNIALSILGGNVQGFALKTQIIGLDTISQSTEPTNSDKSVTIARTVGVVYASTQWYWNNTSKSPAEKNTKTRNLNITLPTMRHEDDGHMVWVKRGSNDGSTLRIYSGGSYHKEYNSSTGKYEDKYYTTYLITENDIEETYNTKFDKEGYAALYVYFRDLTVTMNNVTYKGAWIEFRNPRYW